MHTKICLKLCTDLHCILTYTYLFHQSISPSSFLIHHNFASCVNDNWTEASRVFKVNSCPPYDSRSLGSGESTEYLGIISFQLHTLTCQAVVSFYALVPGEQAQAGHMHLGNAAQTYDCHVEMWSVFTRLLYSWGIISLFLPGRLVWFPWPPLLSVAVVHM